MPDNPNQFCEPKTITTVVVNGAPFEIATPATIASLIAARHPRPPFAVELNKRLVARKTYAATPLTAGDHVEIVTLVGGG